MTGGDLSRCQSLLSLAVLAVVAGCGARSGLLEGASSDAAAAGDWTPLLHDGPRLAEDAQSLQGDGPAGCKHPPVVEDCQAGWCTIPSGCYTMGSPPSELCREFFPTDPKETQRQVTLTRPFLIQATEVTQGQFEGLMKYDPAGGMASEPVQMVNWHEAAAYCNALSAKHGLETCYTCVGEREAVTCKGHTDIYSCKGYRLPTEAEWEYAYRAGTVTAYYVGQNTNCTGDPLLHKIAWYGDVASTGWETPHPVGQKIPNAWGLYDLSGNVAEWCHDRMQIELGKLPVIDPQGPISGAERIQRGGSYGHYARLLRAAARTSYPPSVRTGYFGFRCVRRL